MSIVHSSFEDIYPLDSKVSSWLPLWTVLQLLDGRFSVIIELVTTADVDRLVISQNSH